MLPLRTLAFVVHWAKSRRSPLPTASLAAVLFGADDPSDFLRRPQDRAGHRPKLAGAARSLL
eukprot:140491-Hanusia_phi.AAC.1